MRRSRPLSLIGLTAAMLLLAPDGADAQTMAYDPRARAAANPLSAASPSAADLRLQVEENLRAMVQIQNEFFGNYGTYTDELDFSGFEATSGVRVRMIRATPNGWAAVASHEALEGESCVVWVGVAEHLADLPVTARERKVATEGMPACDGDGLAPHEARRRVAAGAMRATLWRLARAELVHFGHHGSYADDLATLEGWTPAVDAEVTLLFVRPDGWAARSTHPEVSGKSCVVWTGKVGRGERPRTAGGRVPAEGVVGCDE